jgi:5-methylcytosine-specific restriction protein A
MPQKNAMPRATNEWVGANDDSKIPERVRIRVVARANQCCAACKLRVGYGGAIDHVVALKNWNPTEEAPHGNREGNLQFLCRSCHTKKTGEDVAEKSAVYQKRKKLGPLKRGQSEWSKRYHLMKEWKKRQQDTP